MDNDPHTDSLVAFLPVTCPWCFEPGEIALEADVNGEFIVDCEVCCRPWNVRIRESAEGRIASAERAG